VLLPGALQGGDRTFERGVEAYALRLKADTAERDRSYAPGEADRTYAEALGRGLPPHAPPRRPLPPRPRHALPPHRQARAGPRSISPTATTMYRGMGLTYWLEKAEAEMRELG
jgi:hypothetical protein